MISKEMVLLMIKGRGICSIPVVCQDCPINCTGSSMLYYVSNETKYKKALKYYIERYGKDEDLLEALI